MRRTSRRRRRDRCLVAERIERTFLALCIAMPASGHEALARVGDEDFGAELNARAATHLRAHLDNPTDGIGDDDELARLITELVVRAARGTPTPELLRAEELQLGLARIDRQIVAARAGGAAAGISIADLARERASVKAQLDSAIDSAMDASVRTS